VGCLLAAALTTAARKQSTQQPAKCRSGAAPAGGQHHLGDAMRCDAIMRGAFPTIFARKSELLEAGTEAVSLSEPRLWTGTAVGGRRRRRLLLPFCPLPCRPGVEDMTGSSCAAGRGGAEMEDMWLHTAPCLLTTGLDWTGPRTGPD
jgi:hypothetical protein